MIYRMFEPCRAGDCAECVEQLAQPSERTSGGLVDVRCACECHEATQAELGEAGA